MRLLLTRAVWALVACGAAPAQAQTPTPTQTQTLNSRIDALVTAAMQQSPWPGVAVAVVQQGQVVHQRGYGVADVVTGQPVDMHTMFKLGSISKPITAMALALLVDEGRLAWSDPLQRFLPELKTVLPALARVTVQQLLSHQTGVDLEPLEVLMWPQPNAFSFGHFVKGVARLRGRAAGAPGFRYSNLNYLLAAELIERVARVRYRDFVEQRLFAPLGMRCVAGGFGSAQRPHMAQSHLLVAGKLQPVRVDADTLAPGLDAAAGGVRCDVTAMARWLQLQMRGPADALPLSAQTWQQLHTGLVATGTASQTYGLGLQITASPQGVRWDHDGGVAGAVAHFVVWPQAHVALAVMINRNDALGRNALVAQLRALLAPAPLQAQTEANAAVVTPAADAPAIPPTQALSPEQGRRWAGRYADAWFGEVQLCPRDGELRWTSRMSPRLSGRLRATDNGRVALIWDDAAVDSDSVLARPSASAGTTSIPAFALQPLSAQGLSDFDFSALHFKRVGPCAAPRPAAVQGTSQRAP